MKKDMFAFTLAEVLITLGIIGVVAAVTLPALIQNYQKKVTAARLKEAYSILNQAVEKSKIENGDIINWNFGELHFNDIEAKEFLDTYIAPYLKVTKKCYTSTCLKTTKLTLSGREYSAYLEIKGHKGRSLFLSNGMQVWAYTHATATPRNVGLVVDLNGEQNPNTAGRDIFFFVLSQDNTNKVSLSGTEYGVKNRENLINQTGEGCNKTAGNVAGRYCGALIQRDGWEIKDDYPWQ